MRSVVAIALAALVVSAGCGRGRTADDRAAADGAAESVYLTWMRDPTTTMTVRSLQVAPALPVVDGHDDVIPDHVLPRVHGVRVDGDAGEWWDSGFAIDLLTTIDGSVPVPADLAARARLAWTEDGLLVAVRVVDDVRWEHAEAGRLWQGDSVEVYVAEAVGSSRRWQALLAPGGAPGEPAPRRHLNQYEPEATADGLAAGLAGGSDRDGWHIEALLPWTNLPGWIARDGAGLAIQLRVNDGDGGKDLTRLVWFPSDNAHLDPRDMHAVRLGAAPSAPVRAAARFVRSEDGGHALTVIADPALTGRRLRVTAGPHGLAEAELIAGDGVARAVIALPPAPADRRWGRIDVVLDDGPLATLASPAAYVTLPPETLRWWPADGDEAAASTVTCSARPIRFWESRTLQHAELTGLRPDTRYRFRIGAGAVHEFRTLTADPARPLRLAMGGDVRHSRANMERTNRVAMRADPDAVVWGGDLAYANGEPANVERWEEFFAAMHDTLRAPDGRLVPLVVTIGNHEVRGGYTFNHGGYEQTDAWRERIAPFYYQFFPFPGQPGWAALDVGRHVSLLLLDTDHANPVAGVQTEWLAAALASRRDVTHVIPVYHVPSHPSARPFSDRTAAAVRTHWLPLFEAHGVRLAFEHHDHAYKRTHPIRGGAVDPEGIVLLGDGAWGVGTRKVHDPAKTWYLARAVSVRHCIILTIEGPRWRIETFAEDGTVIDAWPPADAPAHR